MTDSYIQNLLGENEKILLITRQHVFLLLRSMAWEFLAAAAIIIVVTLLTVFVEPFQPYAPFGYLLLLLPAVGVLIDTIVWRNKVHIITTRRVIQVSGVFNKNVTDSSLEKVNDVKMEQSFLGRVFDYGDVEIMTASELGINLLQMISHPVKFKTAMLNAKEQMGYEENGGGPGYSHRPVAATEVPDMIARLDDLRRQGILSEEEFRAKKEELLRKID